MYAGELSISSLEDCSQVWGDMTQHVYYTEIYVKVSEFRWYISKYSHACNHTGRKHCYL